MAKKIIVTIMGLFCLFGTMKAQYTPTKGDVSIEVSFNPFIQDAQFSIDGLKIRYFISDKNTLRLNLGFSKLKNKHREDLSIPQSPVRENFYSDNAYQNAKEQYIQDLEEYEEEKNEYSCDTYSTFNLDLGYEYHFYTHNRIDLYAGAQIGLEKCWAKSKEVNYSDGYESIYTKKGRNSSGQKSSIGFGVDLFTGIDFYVYKGLYLGTELGLGVEYNSVNNIKEEYKTEDPSYDYESRSYEIDVKDKSIDTKIKITPTLRLGWTF
ncbi:MAG: hypothetical protein IJY36_08045 [Coprobacter sp.]|nr:hypothetical protein [Coprobacter sp.]